MGEVVVIILHPTLAQGARALTVQLQAARAALAAAQSATFARAGAEEVWLDAGRGPSFGEHLAALAAELPPGAGLIVLSSGAVPRLSLGDAQLLVAAAAAPGRQALTNNRYSSDVCAVSEASTLRGVPPLPGDNALPRWPSCPAACGWPSISTAPSTWPSSLSCPIHRPS